MRGRRKDLLHAELTARNVSIGELIRDLLDRELADYAGEARPKGKRR